MFSPHSFQELAEGVSFIGKPYSPSSFARKVRDVLDRE
jgi:hypothetical protein